MFTPTDSMFFFSGKVSDVRVGDTIRCEAANKLIGEDPLRYLEVAEVTRQGFEVVGLTFIIERPWVSHDDTHHEEVNVRHDEDVMLSLTGVQGPIMVTPMGNLVRYWVNVYELDMGYGGPEEGGWWYDTGTAKMTVPFASDDDAHKYAAEFRENNPDEGNLYSVVYRGGAMSVVVEEHMAKDWSSYAPYE